MRVPLMDLRAQYGQYKEEVTRAIADVCESQMFCLGGYVEDFEGKASAYCGCEYAIGLSSGTDALLLSLMALDIGPGDEVITTPFTFFATAGAVARVGARPVFVDADEDSYNIDAGKIEERITERTRAIIPAHLFGQVAQMKAIKETAARHNVMVIEDAAQAMGAMQDGKRCGGLGDIGCFSFYPTKNLGAFGDAGLVTTNNGELAEKVRVLRVHGENPRYFYRMIGGNFRMDNIQGAVLGIKLKYLDRWNEKRRENAAYYDAALAGSALKTPKTEANNVSIYHQYTITSPKRDELQKYLAERGIGSGVFYPQPLHLQDCFKDLGYKAGDFPVAERLCREVLSIPVYAEMTGRQREYVAKMVVEFCE